LFFPEADSVVFGEALNFYGKHVSQGYVMLILLQIFGC
jgi:hypothetical protein